MMRAAAGQPLHLRTSLPPLDEALGGGLPAGSVTEVGRRLPLLVVCLQPARICRRWCKHIHTAFPPCPAPLPTRTHLSQVVGPAGLGKTQLCLQLAVACCLERAEEGGAVAYIDTERKFSARR